VFTWSIPNLLILRESLNPFSTVSTGSIQPAIDNWVNARVGVQRRCAPTNIININADYDFIYYPAGTNPIYQQYQANFKLVP
jgi:hypothetical protein